MVEKGWQEAYEDNRYGEEDEAKEEVREQNLPLLEAGMKIGQPKISLREGKTKPPARFTEGTLLSAMENPVRYMENRDSSLVKTIGEAGGLGTLRPVRISSRSCSAAFCWRKKAMRSI